jgi:hypothetical protein
MSHEIAKSGQMLMRLRIFFCNCPLEIAPIWNRTKFALRQFACAGSIVQKLIFEHWAS